MQQVKSPVMYRVFLFNWQVKEKHPVRFCGLTKSAENICCQNLIAIQCIPVKDGQGKAHAGGKNLICPGSSAITGVIITPPAISHVLLHQVF